MKRRYVKLTNEQDVAFLEMEDQLSRATGLKIPHQELMLRVLKYALADNAPDFLVFTAREILAELDKVKEGRTT